MYTVDRSHMTHECTTKQDEVFLAPTMTVCNYVLVGGLALVLACLVATHLDGMRYETCFNQELREESQRKSWNEIVNQHWS